MQYVKSHIFMEVACPKYYIALRVSKILCSREKHTQDNLKQIFTDVI